MPQSCTIAWLQPVLHALPYGMRRVQIAGIAAGERELANRMRVWFGGISIQERDAILGRVAPDSARSPSIFFAHRLEHATNSVLRSDLLAAGQFARARRPDDDGRFDRRPNAFMDTELAALVARFPDHFLIGRKGGKAVLRATMEKILPPQILTRKKVGFRVPFNQWFRGPHADLVRDLLSSNASEVARLCERIRCTGLSTSTFPENTITKKSCGHWRIRKVSAHIQTVGGRNSLRQGGMKRRGHCDNSISMIWSCSTGRRNDRLVQKAAAIGGAGIAEIKKRAQRRGEVCILNFLR